MTTGLRRRKISKIKKRKKYILYTRSHIRDAEKSFSRASDLLGIRIMAVPFTGTLFNQKKKSKKSIKQKTTKKEKYYTRSRIRVLTIF